MNTYKKFIFQSNINHIINLLINEGCLMFSDDFADRLERIRDKSPVADKIRNMFYSSYNDEDLRINYIDTTPSNDTVSFMSQKKMVSIQSSSRSDGYNSIQHPYTLKGRSDIKVGRAVKSILALDNAKFTDSQIENFINLYKSLHSENDSVFELVSGKDISKYYNSDSYLSDYGRGTLFSSCMADVDNDYFDIYVNSNSCQLLILSMNDKFGEKKIIGRALVWKLKDKICESDLFMDRVYYIRDSDYHRFVKYADENGMMYKKYNNSLNKVGNIFLYKEKEVKGRIEASVNGNCVCYPYLDTLTFINKDLNTISNSGYINGFVLDDTEGEIFKCQECDGTGYLPGDQCDCLTDDCDKCDSQNRIVCTSCINIFSSK